MIDQAVLRTIVYASLFDYPLTLGEITEGLIGERATERDVAAALGSSDLLHAAVERHRTFYFPRGRRDLVDTRRRREAASLALLVAGRGALTVLTRLPFVRMVALSGSLAHLNADEDADFDLFVVVAPGRVWSVTVGALILAKLTGWRRRLCLNFVVSEQALAVGARDVFTANQIVHLRPLSGVSVYRRFLEANAVVARFYPNFTPRPLAPVVPQSRIADAAKRAAEAVLDRTVAPLAERLSRWAYRRYLERRAATWQSRDAVRLEDECLKLHTSSHKEQVLARFAREIESHIVRMGELANG